MEANGKTTWLDTPAGKQLQESLSNEKTITGIDRLLNRIDTLEKAVEKLTTVIEQGPGMVSMVTDMADEAYKKSSSNGVDIEKRLGNALVIAEKLTAPAMMEKLDGLLKFADQAPGLISMTMDMADEGFKQSANNGVYIEERLGNALAIAEKLTAPAMVEKLNGLLGFADQAPGLISMTMDMVDEGFKRSADNGVYIEQRLGNALAVAEKLTAPEMVEKLNGLLELADQAPGLISMAMDSFDEQMGKMSGSGIDIQGMMEMGANASTALSKAETMPPTKVNGIFSMMRALKDPDLQKSLSFLLNVGKAFGQQMDKKA